MNRSLGLLLLRHVSLPKRNKQEADYIQWYREILCLSPVSGDGSVIGIYISGTKGHLGMLESGICNTKHTVCRCLSNAGVQPQVTCTIEFSFHDARFLLPYSKIYCGQIG